jgi:DNA-binding protein H-NS
MPEVMYLFFRISLVHRRLARRVSQLEHFCSRRLTAERNELELRLKLLAPRVETQHAKSSTGRRPYPKVVSIFRHPDRPSETRAGRTRPRWFTAQIKRGKRIDDYRIERQAAQAD